MALATRPKPTAHLKKRTGGHHRHSKHYLKPYWPYLPMLGILGVGLVISNYLSLTQRASLPISNFSTSNLLSDINEFRIVNHKSNLSDNSQLGAAAQTYAAELAHSNSWVSDTKSGGSPWVYIKNSGYSYQLVGANEAYGFSNARQTVNAWMNSAIYRDNILSSNYQNVGFGVAQSSNYQGKGPATIVVADYGEPVSNSTEITFQVPNPTVLESTTKPVPIAAQPVSRLQMLSSEPLWATSLVGVITLTTLVFIIAKYGVKLKRALSMSEVFIIEHPLLDIFAILVVTVGFILTRTSGFIN